MFKKIRDAQTSTTAVPVANVQIQVPVYSAPAKQDAKSKSNDHMRKAMEILRNYNTAILVDDSTSMSWSDAGYNSSRWQQAVEAMTFLVKIAGEFDDDGVDVCFINNPSALNLAKGVDINKVLKDNRIVPNGCTPLGARVKQVLDNFISELSNRHNKKVKPLNFIVLTDGVADDKDVLESSIVSFCKKLQQMGCTPNDWAGIQFFQVGADKPSTQFLESLDNDLKKKYGIPDIVDCTVYDPASHLPLNYIIQKALLGSVDGEADQDGYKSMYTK